MAEIKWAESAHHLPIEGFSPNPKNPKKHTKKQLEHIRNSILHFGFLDPIGVWGKDHVVGGRTWTAGSAETACAGRKNQDSGGRRSVHHA